MTRLTRSAPKRLLEVPNMSHTDTADHTERQTRHASGALGGFFPTPASWKRGGCGLSSGFSPIRVRPRRVGQNLPWSTPAISFTLSVLPWKALSARSSSSSSEVPRRAVAEWLQVPLEHAAANGKMRYERLAL